MDGGTARRGGAASSRVRSSALGMVSLAWGEKASARLRAAGHLPPGERGVRIAFSIPSSEVLPSDFDAWHAVLNRHPYIRDDEDYETVMQQYEALKGREKQDFLERTWQGIFLKPGVHWPEDLSIQGVFWELRRERVAEARPFRAR